MVKLPRVRPRSAKEIETIAEGILRQFQPECIRELAPFDVEDFFEEKLEEHTDIAWKILDLPQGIDAYTDAKNMICVIANSVYDCKQRVEKIRRLRSTLAHEIGHCILHVPEARKSLGSGEGDRFEMDESHRIERYDPAELKVYENPEWQAWRFASALLMPEGSFRRAIDVGWTLRQVKDAFGVNPSFVNVRLRELNIKKILRKG